MSRKEAETEKEAERRETTGTISLERRADYRKSKCYDGHVLGEDGKCANCGKELIEEED